MSERLRFGCIATMRSATMAAAVFAGAVLMPVSGARGAAADNRIPDFVAGHGGWTMINTNATNYILF